MGFFELSSSLNQNSYFINYSKHSTRRYGMKMRLYLIGFDLYILFTHKKIKCFIFSKWGVFYHIILSKSLYLIRIRFKISWAKNRKTRISLIVILVDIYKYISIGIENTHLLIFQLALPTNLHRMHTYDYGPLLPTAG